MIKLNFKLKSFFFFCLKILHLSFFSTSSVPTLKPVLAYSCNITIIILGKKMVLSVAKIRMLKFD